MLDTFTIGRQDILCFIDDLNTKIRLFLQNNYSNADIYGSCELIRLSSPLFGDMIELCIRLHYFDAEVTDSNGKQVFNEGVICYLSPDYIEDIDLEFFFVYSSSTDQNTFLPSGDEQNSIENQLGQFIFC